MIISRTPLRISFLGGGTDYPDYFRHHGGEVLASAIDKYVYLMVSPLTPFFDHRIRLAYSRTELCNAVDEVRHPSVRESMRFLGITGGVEINVASDLPARTGLGSSSSFTVGLLHSLHAFQGRYVAASQLAEEAVHVEQRLISERVGCQDQYLAAFGGFNHIRFDPNGTVSVTPVPLPDGRLAELGQRLLIFYTGLQRSAHDILEEQVEETRRGHLDDKLAAMKDLVSRGIECLTCKSSLDSFGCLLHEAWEVKRSLSTSVSNPVIDAAYAAARSAGALGGKLLGAGGGGFLVVYCAPDRQPEVRTALRTFQEVFFRLGAPGSQIIFYDAYSRAIVPQSS